jgi:hypothetical protein
MGAGVRGWGVMLIFPPSIAEVKNEWSYTSIPLVCIYGMDIKSFAFFTLGPLLK